MGDLGEEFLDVLITRLGSGAPFLLQTSRLRDQINNGEVPSYVERLFRHCDVMPTEHRVFSEAHGFEGHMSPMNCWFTKGDGCFLYPEFFTGIDRVLLSGANLLDYDGDTFPIILASELHESTDAGDIISQGQPLIDWLTGSNTRVSSVRPFSTYNSINRTTARYFIESTLTWLKFVGYAGTVILLDNARVMLPRNPRDGLRYYSKAMAIDHYELLREFIDGTDRLTATLMIVVPTSDFLDTDHTRRGYGIYQALMTRVMDDVRDKSLVNPIAPLVSIK